MSVVVGSVRVVFATLFCLVVTFHSAHAQSPRSPEGSVTVRGNVLDGQRLPVKGAAVTIKLKSGGTVRVLESEADGAFDSGPLPSQPYVVDVRAAGFATTSRTVDATGAIEVVLLPAAVVEDVSVVSADRQQELRQSLNRRVDVLSRARIEESGATTVGEVLREVPGVVTRRGSEGTGAAGEQIQGIDSRQVLVLVDGLPLVGARGIKRGVMNLDRESLGSIERIEVVKGAASALYGSDAIGGVINMITRGSSAPISAGASFGAGTRGALDASAEAGFRRERWAGLFLGERHQIDEFDLTPTTPDTTGAATRRTDGFGKLGWRASDAVSLNGLVTGYHNRTTGFSNGELGPQQDDIRETTLNASAASNWQLAPMTTTELRAHHARFDEDSEGALVATPGVPLERGLLDERLTRVDGTIAHVLGQRQQIQGGVEYTHDEYAGVNRLRTEAGESVWTGTVWGQHRLFAGPATATLGVRVDKHSIFGTAVSPKAGVNVGIGGNVSLRASYGRGYRAPDVGQLYYRFLNPTNSYQVIGNPDLRAEYAHSIQAGGDIFLAGHRARVGINAFRNDVDDLIDSTSLGFAATPAQVQAIVEREGLDPSFRPVAGRLLLTYGNVADAVTQGVELDSEVAITRQVSVGGAYTYLDARDATADLALTGRHRHQGHVRASWAEARIGLRASLRGTFYSSWIVSRTIGASGTVETVAPKFALWDVFVWKRITHGLSGFLAVDNLADSQDPNTGVVMPDGSAAAIYRPEYGRTARLGLTWTWAR